MRICINLVYNNRLEKNKYVKQGDNDVPGSAGRCSKDGSSRSCAVVGRHVLLTDRTQFLACSYRYCDGNWVSMTIDGDIH